MTATLALLLGWAYTLVATSVLAFWVNSLLKRIKLLEGSKQTGFGLGFTEVNIPLQRNTIPNSERGGFKMENWMAQASGVDLQKSFLISVQQWQEMMKRVKKCDVTVMPDVALESLVREIIVREQNLQELQEKLSLELGLPISH